MIVVYGANFDDFFFFFLKFVWRIFSYFNCLQRRPKLGAFITASFDTASHITNDLKTLYEKFNIVVKT